MIIPAGWDVPDAGAVPTDDNRDGLKGTLESAPAKVGDLISAAPPPNPLFAAHGSIGPGLEVGVTVGAYDIGSPATSGSLRKQLLAAGSSAKIDDFTVATSDGLRITPPPGTPPGPGGASVVADYWVGIPHHPNQVAIVRFWQRAGPASSSSGSATRESTEKPKLPPAQSIA
jgi:hypothetical protein